MEEKGKKSENMAEDGHVGAAEWCECLKREARAVLVVRHGIEQPTDHQICMYVLYGEKSLCEERI